MKAMLKSGFIGGCYGVLVQLLYMLFQSITGGSNYSQAFALVAGGCVIFILIISNILAPIEKHGGFGAIIPLIGLTSAVTGTVNGTRKATGKEFISAFMAGPKPMTLMLGAAMAWSLIMSTIVCTAQGNPGFVPDLTAYTAIGEGPMGIVWSFVVMFVIGFIGQWLLMALKPSFAGVMGLLFGAHVVGNVLSWFGIGQILNAIAPGGFGVPILGGGEFLFNAVYLGHFNLVPPAPYWTQTIEMIIIYTGIVGAMYVFGGLAAAIRAKAHPEEIRPEA